ncbi:MAG: DUF4340 domain-containing protein [Bacteroidota bacterium]|nr:DUF4340 domain-containing protein [Bacteroidota bacterium]
MENRAMRNRRLMMLLLTLFISGAIVIIYIISYAQKHEEIKQEVVLESLLPIDTSKVSGWRVIHEEDSTKNVTVVRSSSGWKVALPSGKSVEASPDLIRRSLLHMALMKPNSLETNKKEKWEELGVHEKGARLIVFEGGRESAAIYLGEMFFLNDVKANHYVRLPQDNNVYTVDLYLDGSLRAPLEKYRKKELMNCEKPIISFAALSKPVVNNTAALNARKAICDLKPGAFVSRPDTEPLGNWKIIFNDSSFVSVLIWADDSTYILGSTFNQGNYLSFKNESFPEALSDLLR